MKATGTVIPRDLSIALTMAATVSKPVIYLPAPSDTQGLQEHSSPVQEENRLSPFKVIDVELSDSIFAARALSNISLAETNIFLYSIARFCTSTLYLHIIKNEKEYLYDIYVLIQRNMMYNHVCPKKISKERRPVWVI
ncbi:MAG: hypothetical protein ACLS9K_04410 [Lachnospira eligens]